MKYLLILLAFCISSQVSATHNYAGEIKVEQIGVRTIRATIITYTPKDAIPTDRKQLDINWGDSRKETIQRSEEVPFDDTSFKKNLYTQEHTYEIGGTYTVSMTDPNRNGGILNVNYPQSDAIAFHIQTTITLVAQTPKQTYNTTPTLNRPPMDGGYVGLRFEYQPNAVDADGDSVAYRLITPLSALNTAIGNYELPNKILPSATNSITFSEKTGLFIWESPRQVGLYTIAIEVISYRNGVKIDATVRDMNINITSLTSSVQEVGYESFVKAYPNPVHTEGYLEVNPNFGSDIQMNIINANGQIFKSQKFKNNHFIKIQREDLPAGMYIIRLRSEKYITRLKYVIQ